MPRALRRGLYSVVQLLLGSASRCRPSTILAYYAYRAAATTLPGAQLIHDTFVPALLTLSLEMMAVSLAFTVALIPIGLIGVYLVPRLLSLFLRDDQTYALYGVHYFISQAVSA